MTADVMRKEKVLIKNITRKRQGKIFISHSLFSALLRLKDHLIMSDHTPFSSEDRNFSEASLSALE